MTRTVKRFKAARPTFILDRAKSRSRAFKRRGFMVVTSVAGLCESLAQPTRDAFWISYDKQLTKALVKNIRWRDAPLGEAVFVHPLEPQSFPALSNCFDHFAYTVDGSFLPPEELLEALADDTREDLFIGGSIDHATRTITLWRGNLASLTVPFSAFPESGEGMRPDFHKFSVTDSGQTVKLGRYEAAADAILYEFDPAYRRRRRKERAASEQTFGASVRRLRKQRGLRREDFGPEIAAKTVARIEQGKVSRIHRRTRAALAERLGVAPDEVGTF